MPWSSLKTFPLRRAKVSIATNYPPARVIRGTLTLNFIIDHNEFIQGWEKFLKHLAVLDIYDAPNLKRIIDGRALAKALGIPPGIWMGKALDICMAWQLRNPAETSPEGAIQEEINLTN
jgi:hypothetical protein